MSPERYAVASELWQAGYQIRAICETVGVSRSSFYRWRQAGSGFPDRKYLGSRDPAGDGQILASIQGIKMRHPFWGYRRVRAWLKYREDSPVGHKRVYRLMKENGLLVPQKRYQAKRQPAGRKPRAQRPGQFWGIDMTKFFIPGLGWAYLVIVLDWFSRKVVGRQLSLSRPHPRMARRFGRSRVTGVSPWGKGPEAGTDI